LFWFWVCRLSGVCAGQTAFLILAPVGLPALSASGRAAVAGSVFVSAGCPALSAGQPAPLILPPGGLPALSASGGTAALKQPVRRRTRGAAAVPPAGAVAAVGGGGSGGGRLGDG